MHLTPDELARLTGRSPEDIRRWVREGRIPAQRAGRHILVGPDAIDRVQQIPRVNRRRPTLAL